MVRMDSDIMGIVMALLTFLVPVISAIIERNRKKRNGGVAQSLPDDNDPFGEFEEETQPGHLETIEEIAVETVETVETVGTVKTVETVETLGALGTLDSAVGIQNPLAEQEKELPEEKKKGLGERLKRNPADMVLFAEIMNPKYKEL